MKKKFSYFAASLGLLASFATPLLVRAEGSNTTGSGGSTTTGSDDKGKSTVSPDITQPAAPDTTKSTGTETETNDDKVARTKRVENDKKNLKETVTDDEKKHISDKCVSAQEIVKKKQDDNNAAETSHLEIYNTIVTNLQALSTTLASKGVAVKTLNIEIASLQLTIKNYIADDSAYKQALNDLALLDCKTDPVAFKATLEDARTKQKIVLSDAVAIRSYLSNTIKTTLVAIKDTVKTDAAQ
jgi:hypothetical protein